MLIGKNSQTSRKSGNCSKTTAVLLTTGLAIIIFSGIQLKKPEEGLKLHKATHLGRPNPFNWILEKLLGDSLYNKKTKRYEKKYMDNLIRKIAMRDFSVVKATNRGNVEKKVIPPEWNSIEIDAPFHTIIKGNSLHTYYYDPAAPQDCWTSYKKMPTFDNQNKEIQVETSWLAFNCKDLMSFSFGKIKPSIFEGKIEFYFDSDGTSNAYGKKKEAYFITELNFLKNGKEESLSTTVKRVTNWRTHKAAMIDTKAKITLGKGQKEADLASNAALKGGKYALK